MNQLIDEQPISQTAVKPWLASLLIRRRPRLSSRFFNSYRQLCHLPRWMRRRLTRQLALPLVGVALALALSRAPVSAATIVVDNGGGSVADDGFCSLPEAILNANNDVQVFYSAGECEVGSGTTSSH